MCNTLRCTCLVKNKTVCANCYKCADPVIIYAVSVTLYPILKICNLNLLNITHCHLSVEQCCLQYTEPPREREEDRTINT